jgi:hypothetical protein
MDQECEDYADYHLKGRQLTPAALALLMSLGLAVLLIVGGFLAAVVLFHESPIP